MARHPGRIIKQLSNQRIRPTASQRPCSGSSQTGRDGVVFAGAGRWNGALFCMGLDEFPSHARFGQRCGYVRIRLMFESIEPDPRGFAGRPFISLVLAVGLGIVAAQVSSWFHLNDFIMLAISVVAVVVVGYSWERLETPHRDT